MKGCRYLFSYPEDSVPVCDCSREKPFKEQIGPQKGKKTLLTSTFHPSFSKIANCSNLLPFSLSPLPIPLLLKPSMKSPLPPPPPPLFQNDPSTVPSPPKQTPQSPSPSTYLPTYLPTHKIPRSRCRAANFRKRLHISFGTRN